MQNVIGQPIRQRLRANRGLVITVVGVLLAIAAVAAGTILLQQRPEDAVEDYLEAIHDKDIAEALELVSRKPNEEDPFLVPEAIRDGWTVTEIVAGEVTGQHDDEAQVKATITDANGATATGKFVVNLKRGEWRIVNPFVRVRFDPSPLAYAEVNGAKVPIGRTSSNFRLFPGVYQFYTSVPGVVDVADAPVVAAFPRAEGDDPVQIAPHALAASPETVQAVQREITTLVDECATRTTTQPDECPFATDGYIDTQDGKRVTEPENIAWTVREYPAITLVDRRERNRLPGFRVGADRLGRIELAGSGEGADGDDVDFSVECRISPEMYLATVSADGTASVKFGGRMTESMDNTCPRNP